jgi:3-hydroxyisobutyrate dehydrogenase
MSAAPFTPQAGPPAPEQCTGVIGIGNMGLPMALRLLDAGWPVCVHDLRAEPMQQAQALGAALADTPAALASRCSLVLVVVVNAAQVHEVLFGAQGLVQARPLPRTVLLCPTIAPEDTEACARGLADAGVACIDAPMSGGPGRARDGSMSLMLAGDAAVLQQHAAVLRQLSDQQVYLGPRLGDGARTKLVNNLLAASNLAAACEAMALARQLGLDPQRTLDLLARSSGQSWIGKDRLQRALAGDTAPRAHTSLLAKDSALAMAMAARAGMQPQLGALAARMFAQACADGWADADDSCLLAWLQALQGPAQRG